MKSNYLRWGLAAAAAVSLAFGLGASLWPIVLVSLVVGEVTFLFAMRDWRNRRKAKAR